MQKPKIKRNEINKAGYYFQSWGQEVFIRHVYKCNNGFMVSTHRNDGAIIVHPLTEYSENSDWQEIDIKFN